jgi:hypothetical protein
MYAWMRQMATSNRIYPTVVIRSRINPVMELNHAAAQ